MSVVCGRVRKVADRVKGVKRGGWTLNGIRSDTKELCRLLKRCLWRSRKTKNASIQGEAHYIAVRSWDYRCIQAHTHLCSALCLPFMWIKIPLMPHLQLCLQGKDAFSEKGRAGHCLCPCRATVSGISLSTCCQQHPHLHFQLAGQFGSFPLEHKELCSAPPALHGLVPQFSTWACKNQSWALTRPGCRSRDAFFTPCPNMDSLIVIPRKVPWTAKEKQEAA